MYKSRFVQYVNLPEIPEHLLLDLPKDINLYTTQCKGNYHWSDSHNTKLNAWAQKNISNEMYFAFQLMTGDLAMHKDIDTQTKLVYLLETGGTNVLTKFWDDSGNLLDTYAIETNRWHILKVDTYHSVEGVEKDKIRRSITARIF